MIRQILIIIILIATLSSCLDLSDGSNTIIKESSNKEHSKKMILFLRTAGATVGNSYQVSIRDYNNTFDTTEVGNTFTFDTDHGKTGFDSTSINFIWKTKDTLVIEYDKKLRTFIQNKNVRDVTIVYAPK